MIVTFISQCEKKALSRTRRVLDAYANRIGDNVWQTIITDDGLLMVKKLLRKTASKNTAVSCHWIRSRRRSELLWIVGNHSRFNEMGYVPVNSTRRALLVRDSENDWPYLDLMKGLTALAALLHDWGKCSDLFQSKLVTTSQHFKGDPIRHEWISCLLLRALVETSGDVSTDAAWLMALREGAWQEKTLQKKMAAYLKDGDFTTLGSLPPMAQMVAWLMVSHHRLPDLPFNEAYDEFSEDYMPSLRQLLKKVAVSWHYQNQYDESYDKRLKKCFQFKEGLLQSSPEWMKALKRWTGRALAVQDKIEMVMSDGSWRIIIQNARLGLMLADHYVSSLPKEIIPHKQWQPRTPLLANTDRKTREPKQYLDEHIVGVYTHALKAIQALKSLTLEMPQAHDLRAIKRKSPPKFAWQDLAVKKIRSLKKESEDQAVEGWFVVNMASTGTGKTIANAKMMQALSNDWDALRYVLALGLRTLTLQTGDSYRENLGMAKDELAVLIGSRAVQALHEQAKLASEHSIPSYEEVGSESLESLLEEPVLFEDQYYPDFLEQLFPQDQACKSQAFLYKPVLVCTIDHMMAATESTRGGRHLLPYLRLLSSDLVIDEVDDFGIEDLIPIARLVHLAGMLGRKVMISSATIPPSLAEGLFNAYQKGWQAFCAFRQLKKVPLYGMWVDEFKAEIVKMPQVASEPLMESYQQSHHAFIEKRVARLLEAVVKQHAKIVQCDDLLTESGEDSRKQRYFARIQESIIGLHQAHHTVDDATGKRVSFGVVRVANIPPCIDLTRYLLSANWADGIVPRVLAYHSRQILLLRSVQERHLDEVLSRKEKAGEMPKAFSHPVIRQHIDGTDGDDVIFILVATPVEEVGRDHDFDWAVIEPSSYRSIIQLAGRVRRHRPLEADIATPNIALMQYNLKGIHGKNVAFERPGFELDNARFRLVNKDLMQLMDHDQGQLPINAIARIQMGEKLASNASLADLEHARIQAALTDYEETGAKPLQGWLDEVWFLTGLPQRFYRFRQSSPAIRLCAVYEDEDIRFKEQDQAGDWVDRTTHYQITSLQLTELEQSRLWLVRDYRAALLSTAHEDWAEYDEQTILRRASYLYGEISLPSFDDVSHSYHYSDQLGLMAARASADCISD
ncbi:type I-F CRISPR-associated helicase Cas3f [Wohlfahrtiimonas chitiniclastica]|uniref:type I-F CRISPR-associated helicase Cas3f n=1 Tax=Wohlfahrtiimonas chitiniclastica TaxID=400946 RepID=UPI002157150B|nr:type I-F CRISPR-associated helicase Cas3f [Wohlfahrtiimonas chitiniclastica]MDC7252397.1 type I-F CRISPR-associated helicase Cas3 [Wohlfahrtiimonas chitiniclastica]